MPFSSTRDKAIVLVVEDEPVIRMLAADIVEEAGFEPIESADADEAIAILEARSDIRLVFTDIDMPGMMNGLKFAACVRDRWPPIAIIVTSGKAIPPGVTLPVEAVFIPKPFAIDHLVAALRQLAGELPLDISQSADPASLVPEL